MKRTVEVDLKMVTLEQDGWELTSDDRIIVNPEKHQVAFIHFDYIEVMTLLEDE